MRGTHLLGGNDTRYAPTIEGMMPGTYLLLGAFCELRAYSEGMMRGTQLLGGHNDGISARYAPTRRE
jgi:hypothetical protein